MHGAPRHKHHMKISEVAQCIHSYTSVQNCSLGLFPAFMELLIANMPSKSKRKIHLEAASATKRAKVDESSSASSANQYNL